MSALILHLRFSSSVPRTLSYLSLSTNTNLSFITPMAGEDLGKPGSHDHGSCIAASVPHSSPWMPSPVLSLDV